MLRLLTDFDGPIADVSDRYYRVYQHCLARCQHPGQAIAVLSQAEFWRLKRARVPERQIGQRSGLEADQARQFARLRRETIHSLRYLNLDKLVPGAIAALERLQQFGFDLAVVTMRRDHELAVPLTRYELARFFPPERRFCIGDTQVKSTDVQDKPSLLARALSELPPAGLQWMVGDTEADLLAAQAHGVPSIAVLSGIRDRAQLAQYDPDFIVSDLSAAAALVIERALSLAH
ncbi:MAG: HAD family hydrolase [Spirulinaceae cyanobacterium RM2_2_10]|nr:HAD family hydrolase [Spirulinaceae cyanobacterium SM2_1_0]NJO20667.1 HAD family hydrolase [Spirulinaceae cyanobacterium RM2_2_10]